MEEGGPKVGLVRRVSRFDLVSHLALVLIVRRIHHSTQPNVLNKTSRSSLSASSRRPCRLLRTSVKVPCLGRRTGRVLERRRRSKSLADAPSYRTQSSQSPPIIIG